MIQNNIQRVFLILTFGFIIISGNLIMVYPDTQNLTLKIKFAPSGIESSESTHKIGYVWFENKQGNPISFTNDVTIKLESENSKIASIPPQVTIPQGKEFATFDVQTHGTRGVTTVFASYNKQLAYNTLFVGEQDPDLESDLNLVINLPTQEMNVNSQMPFSLYLEDSDGKILQAPFDVNISLDYEESLIKVEMPDSIIKKGDSYVWGTIITKDRVGNSFLRATVDKLGIDEAKEIKISSSLPSSLKINVFPEKIPATLKRDLDVIVTLVDSDGLPTLAQEDVKLDFFSDDESLNNQIDRKIKDDNLDTTIKKGEFSYRFSQRLDLFKENTTITIGAATKGLGVASDTFETVKPITTNNPIAENKTMQVFVLDKIPTKSQSVAIYQIGMLVEQPDDKTGDDVSETTTENKKIVFYPLIVNENYDSQGSAKKINIISSNGLLLRVLDAGKINAASSYGAATIETGQETGQTYISSTIKGIGSASTMTEVINTLKQEQTMVFSPTGSDAILFDKNGLFDFFVISLDSKGRPTLVENEIRYLITPINEIVKIEKNHAFTHVNFHGSAIQAGEEYVSIKAVPIGESADSTLEASHTYVKNPTAKLRVFVPYETINTNNDYSGIVQIVDFNDSPIIMQSNLKVKLDASKVDMISMPDSITISAGKSYTEFPITAFEIIGNVEVSAHAKGIVSAKTPIQIQPLTTKLKISIGSIQEPLLVDQPTELKVYVDDELENAVSGATIRVVSSDSSIAQDTIRTQDDGSAVIKFNPKQSPKTSLQIMAYANGFIEEQKKFDFDVTTPVVEKKTEIPQEIIYGGIGAVIAIIVGIFFVLRKPKVQLEDDEEIE
ncbi:MAG: hypothetical protein ABI337_03000 [Nitrososphaera sp.]|jgi:hypothetical protein